MSETPQRKGMFARAQAVVEKTSGGTDLDNLEVQVGSNKFRVITEPILIFKHWDAPVSAEWPAVPCAKFIEPDKLGAYLDAVDAGKVDEFIANLPGECPYCKMHAADAKFYKVKSHWIFNVVQDGCVKVADFHQSSIIKALGNFENDEDWGKLMPNGLVDMEINLKKEQTGSKAQNVKYSVAGIPGSGPLEPEQLANYREQMVDLVTLKKPPATDTEEGKAKWAEFLTKCGAPKPGEAVKSFTK